MDLSRELARRGHDVTHSYCQDYVSGQGRLSEDLELPNFKVNPISLNRIFPKYDVIGRIRFEITYGLKLRKSMAISKPDVLIISNLPLISAWFLRVLNGKLKFILWHQDLYSVGIRHELKMRFGIFGKLLAKPFEYIERYICRKSLHIVAIGDSFLNWYKSKGISLSKISIIENWASLQDFFPKDRDNHWSRAHSLPEGEVKLLYAGTLGKKHNPELLTLLMDNLKAMSCGANLTVISSGEGADIIAANLNGRSDVTVYDFQPIDLMPDIFSSFDLALAILEPSASEFSIPSKVLSYFASGICVAGLMPESNLSAKLIIQNHGFVGTADVSGAQALAHWIAKLGVEQIRVASEVGLEFARREFRVEAKAQQFEMIMHQSLAKQ